MAAADIYLNLVQLKSDIITINDNKLKEIDKAMKSACTAVATLAGSGWSGDAKDAFMEKFTQQKNDMRIFYENVKELNKHLKTIQVNGKKLVAQGNKIAAKL
jgi:uncharacterized protein YukE